MFDMNIRFGPKEVISDRAVEQSPFLRRNSLLLLGNRAPDPIDVKAPMLPLYAL
jgi:hypothetical protein